MGKSKHVIPFEIEGQLLAFDCKNSGKIKGGQLHTSEGNYSLKFAKDLRSEARSLVTPGDWVRVRGKQKIDLKTGECKYKIKQLQPIASGDGSRIIVDKPQPAPAPAKPPKPDGKILVCQKSSCCKKGGKAVREAIESEIDQRGLSDRIEIKKTGCLKGCKAGPNVVVMPAKDRYSRIQPEEVPCIFDKHFVPAEA